MSTHAGYDAIAFVANDCGQLQFEHDPFFPNRAGARLKNRKLL